MKRHMELILRILRHAEQEGKGKPLPNPDFQEYPEEEIEYHIQLCKEAGYLHTSHHKILNLTWNGHEFLDQNRN